MKKERVIYYKDELNDDFSGLDTFTRPLGEKYRFFRKPRIVTYADGPFYPKPELSRMAAARELRDIAYSTMCKRVKAHSNCEYIKYIRMEERHVSL